jgi:hypothetical protein
MGDFFVVIVGSLSQGLIYATRLGFKTSDPPASTSLVLRLQACVPYLSLLFHIFIYLLRVLREPEGYLRSRQGFHSYF